MGKLASDTDQVTAEQTTPAESIEDTTTEDTNAE